MNAPLVSVSRHTAALAIALTLALPGSPSWAGGDAPAAGDFGRRAEAYCSSTGGVVEWRKPMINTNANDPADFAPLAGQQPFCAYTSSDDGSLILISLTTLYSTTPSQAALAYVNPVPYDGSNCFGNPAACYCTQIGGAGNMAAATNGNGGGWVLRGATYQTVETCTFSDGSMIDQWGLTYHASGIVRGKDLTTVLRMQIPGKRR